MHARMERLCLLTQASCRNTLDGVGLAGAIAVSTNNFSINSLFGSGLDKVLRQLYASKQGMVVVSKCERSYQYI